MKKKLVWAGCLLPLFLLANSGIALAADAAPKIDSGDTAFVLIGAALVLLMTPGLAFFYGGMVRRKNVLSTIMHSFIIICLISVQWVMFGYSFAFGPDKLHLFGSLAWLGLSGVGFAPNPNYGRNHTSPGVHGVPDDVCHHHRSPDLRFLCGKVSLPGLPDLHVALDNHRLRSPGALGLGLRWLAQQFGSARFRRRDGRAHQLRCRPAWSRLWCWASAWAMGKNRCCRTTCRLLCWAPGCSGSAGSALTPAAPWPPTAWQQMPSW